MAVTEAKRRALISAGKYQYNYRPSSRQIQYQYLPPSIAEQQRRRAAGEGAKPSPAEPFPVVQTPIAPGYPPTQPAFAKGKEVSGISQQLPSVPQRGVPQVGPSLLGLPPLSVPSLSTPQLPYTTVGSTGFSPGEIVNFLTSRENQLRAEEDARRLMAMQQLAGGQQNIRAAMSQALASGTSGWDQALADVVSGQREYRAGMGQALTQGLRSLGGGQERFREAVGRQLGMISQLGLSQQRQIEDDYRRATGAAQQNLVSRGLGSSTITDTVMRGYQRDRQRALGDVAERKAQLGIGVMSELGRGEQEYGARAADLNTRLLAERAAAERAYGQLLGGMRQERGAYAGDIYRALAGLEGGYAGNVANLLTGQTYVDPSVAGGMTGFARAKTNDGLAGMLAGAGGQILGTLAGSIFGPIGSAIGGGIGGAIGGLFNPKAPAGGGK